MKYLAEKVFTTDPLSYANPSSRKLIGLSDTERVLSRKLRQLLLRFFPSPLYPSLTEEEVGYVAVRGSIEYE